MKYRYWTSAHTKHRLRYHLVWIVKYRRRVLRGKISKRITELLFEACQINRWWIHRFNINENHLHLIIQLQPKDRVSSVVQKLKGGTSKIIREEFPELEEFLWGDSLWADGYFAESVGKVDETILSKYIEDQISSMTQKG